jgi:transposase-like protein
MAFRGEYRAAGYSSDVKDVLGAVGHQLRTEGRSVRDVVELFSKAGYSVGEETVRRWTTASGRDEHIISSNKKTGAKKKLVDKERQVAAGWVLQEKKKSTADATVGL